MSNKPAARKPKADRVKSAEDALGEQALKILLPRDCKPDVEGLKVNQARNEHAVQSRPTTHCATDKGMKPRLLNMQNKKPHLGGLQIGLFDHIPRWRKNVTVNWVAFADGYETPDDALFAAKAMRRATEEWNALDFGVQFKQVDSLEDANFALGYGGQPASRDRVLAEAYFPTADDISDVIVYKLQFNPQVKHEMHNTFLHELGHVLGLRHEHAEWSGRLFEGGSTTIGTTNPKSVMSYDPEEPPIIRDSDKEGIRKFYALRAGETFGGMEVVLYIPDN
ncbi:hypothetical protein LTR84_011299 [Exophiala bonariae]|uniref:Peptidase metallopeptidase domain-containing protein n=1 Tax=Exophiala bonariae TaxID=1690606 RepID=A0AAV9MTU6_9EURO|nr:hypothetical protein LTR84_011299 [Exophiala bonariae]